MQISIEHMFGFFVFLPALSTLLLTATLRHNTSYILRSFVAVTLVVFAFFATLLLLEFPTNNQAVISLNIPWISAIGLNFNLMLDRLNYPFVMLNSLLFVLIAIYCSSHPPKRLMLFVNCFLWLESMLLGAFLAGDLLFFYICWEALLIPMGLIIGVFGATARIQAAMKFLLFTVFGSLPMLLAIVKLYLHQHALGLDLSIASLYALEIPVDQQLWLFLAFFLAFAVKFPLFPVHTWLPAAHVEAPTEGSVILAGLLLKLGSYGLLRFGMPVFPEIFVMMGEWLSIFALIGIIYAALLCLKQDHAKKLIAYSSVSHMGMIALGLFSVEVIGVQGSVFQMINHGITTGALFFLIGMIYHRSERRRLSEFSGLASITPKLAVVFLITTFAAIGLPGLNGFIGEFLILLGIFSSHYNSLGTLYAGIAVLSIILGAAYMLWLVRKMFFGPLQSGLESFADLKPIELVVILPLLILMFWFGMAPKSVLQFIQPASEQIMTIVHNKVFLTKEVKRP